MEMGMWMVLKVVADVYSVVLQVAYWLSKYCQLLVKMQAVAKLERCQLPHLMLTTQWNHVPPIPMPLQYTEREYIRNLTRKETSKDLD